MPFLRDLDFANDDNFGLTILLNPCVVFGSSTEHFHTGNVAWVTNQIKHPTSALHAPLFVCLFVCLKKHDEYSIVYLILSYLIL